MAGVKDYATTAAGNDGLGLFDTGMNAASVDDSNRQQMADIRNFYNSIEWRDLGDTPTYASATTFTLTGDQTANYHVNRAIKCTDLSTLYGYISAVSYTSSTTVTVSLISGSLSASLTAVELGPAATNQSTPPFSDDRPMVVGSADGTKRVIFDADTNITTATTRTIGIPDANTTMVGTDTTQTLTNKTLTAPVISTISNTGTVTLPTATDTLVGRATTDTMTNKTIDGGSNTLTVGNKTIDTGYVTSDTTSTAGGSGALDSLSAGSKQCTAFGRDALTANTTGILSCAFGYQSLYTNISGDGNTAFGYQSLALNTASGNTASGYQALRTNSSGITNTANGYQALYSNTTGGGSTASGHNALYASTGGSNTGYGYNAGNSITTGSNDTCLGYDADASSATVSNEFTLGNSSVATLRCQVTSITALSDERDKDNITDLPIGLDFINALRAVEFDWNMRDGGKVGIHDTGFIAQDLKQAQKDTGFTIPGLVYEENPEKLEAAYGKLIPVMVKAIQELSEEVKMLRGLLNA